MRGVRIVVICQPILRDWRRKNAASATGNVTCTVLIVASIIFFFFDFALQSYYIFLTYAKKIAKFLRNGDFFIGAGFSRRVRHLRTQTESSDCAPDSLKSSGPPLFPTNQQICGGPNGRSAIGSRSRSVLGLHRLTTLSSSKQPRPPLSPPQQVASGAPKPMPKPMPM